MTTGLLPRQQIDDKTLAYEIEQRVRNDLERRYDIYIAGDDELDLTEDNHLVLKTGTGDTGWLPVNEPLPTRYATMLACAICLRDMDGAA